MSHYWTHAWNFCQLPIQYITVYNKLKMNAYYYVYSKQGKLNDLINEPIKPLILSHFNFKTKQSDVC